MHLSFCERYLNLSEYEYSVSGTYVFWVACRKHLLCVIRELHCVA